MSDNLHEMREEYVSALQEYLYEAGESALQRAYELGRGALSTHLGVLDLAAIHQEALVTALLQTLGPDGSGLIARRAADFFMETLSPFEMSQRGVQETVSRMRERNSTLEQRVEERAEQLQQAEQKYHDLFANAVEGIFQITPDGRMITANPALARILGWESPEALLAHEPDFLQRSIDADDLDSLIERIHRDGWVSNADVPARRLDGTTIWISMNVRAIVGADGAVRHYEGSIEDITEHKSAEILAAAQRRVLEMIVAGASAAEVLRALEGLLREQSDATDCAFSLDDAQEGGLMLTASAAETRRWCTPIRSANGQTLATLTLAYPADPTNGALHLPHADLSPAPVPSRHDEPIIAAAVHLARLVIDRERDAEAIRRAEQQRLQTEKLRALGQLASGIAHDLNQSLALVAGYGELAREQILDRDTMLAPADRESLNDMLRIMRQAALDGGETVKQLLTFARGREEGPPARVDVRQVLLDVARLTTPRWRDAAEAVGCHISLDVDAEEGLTIVGWPPSLREALTNLVFNAVDALPNGGVIRLLARKEGRHCRIEISDSGIGMSPDIVARIFEPFFTTKGEGGTGLGLAHVFGVTERHQGQISVHSTPGQGTVFRLEIPAVTQADAASGVATSAVEALAGLRILAVDDEPALTSMIALALRKDGHITSTAGSGEAALAMLTAEPFDVVISDVGMGAGMNGWELARHVQRHWPAIRMMLATGWGADIDPDEARARGITAVISKPYRLADLRRAIREVER